jgi:3-methyladenine DNA glycosylase/8-oxoguanine DNA glycosylase
LSESAIADPTAATRALLAAEPAFERIVHLAGPLDWRLEETPSLFHSLARTITFQQLNGRVAKAIFGRLQALFPGEELLSPEGVLAASDEQLRAAGLSGNKILAVRDLATRVRDGTVPEMDHLRDLPDEEIITRLTTVRGIGRWTAEMLLIFRLGRPDVLPVDDLAVRKGAQLVLGLPEMPKPKPLAERGRAWSPQRTVASLYLYRAVDLLP